MHANFIKFLAIGCISAFLCALPIVHAQKTSLHNALAEAERQLSATSKTTPNTQEPSIEKPAQLANWITDFAVLTHENFELLAKSMATQSQTTIQSLAHSVSALEKTAPHKAIALIFANQSVIFKNIYEKEIANFYRFLVQHNQLVLSDKIEKVAERENAGELLDSIFFEQAKYYADNRQWKDALNLLARIKHQSSLTQDEQDYATLMFGSALQHTKKHREAIKFYDRLKDQSSYFAHAQLNKAIAYIRQGWWTDAQLAIKLAEQRSRKDKTKKMTNRLYLVLGYSQLQNEFYRDARKSFRKITLTSQYATRALMGIGLSALSQKDYAGALNAFERVRDKNEYSIVGLESFLLVAYTQLQMGNLERAREDYGFAINFYKNMLVQINTPGFELVDDNTLANSNDPALSNALATLEYLTLAPIGSNGQKRIQAMKEKLLNIQRLNRSYTAQQASTFITSYLSQCEFGLASLYDKSH